MATRKELRTETAKAINNLSRERLLKEFAISRVSEITGLDKVGVPVYTAARPLSKTIAVHSGKGIEREMARAGAILEAIEFEVAEHPHGPWRVASSIQLPEEEHLPVEECFPVRSSIVNDYTPIAWEEATNIQTGETKLVPSDLVWMAQRIEEQPLTYFQMGSNGLAAGGSMEDAILSGLYEIIERDGWTLNQYLIDNCGLFPARIPLIALPPRLETLARSIDAAGLKLHLFDVSTDYQVPVVYAILLDLSGESAGTFGGFGAHLDIEIAALRAVTEACQGRCSYISGGRDDMFRRNFLYMKRMEQVKLESVFSELRAGSAIADYRAISFPDVRQELRYLLRLIKLHGVSEVYVKELATFFDGTVYVVRVFSPQCEPYKFDSWTPSLRCLSYVKRRMDELGDGRGKTQPVTEEGEVL